MCPDERVELARATYRRAVALAGARSTPASWRRVLVASRNLCEALRSRDCAASGAAAVPGRRSRSGGSRREGSLPSLAPRRGTAARPLGAPAASGPAGRPLDQRASLAEEIARARALVARSRGLVQESRSLCAEIARVTASWPRRVARPSTSE